MKLDLVTYVKNSFTGIDQDLTKLIKEDATKANWPKYIVKSLKISTTDLNITAMYKQDYAEEVDNLEYGNADESPRPVFRKFVTKHEDIIFNKIASLSVDHLFEEGILP